MSSLRASAPRSSFSRRSRSTARALSGGEKKRNVPRPLSLAWNIAASALRRSSPNSAPSPGYTAMPIDAATVSARPSSANGRASESRIRRARTAASSALFTGASSTNSSPPMRASASSPTRPSRRSATARSSVSPTRWSSESLTSLKRSRSKHSSATCERVRAALRIARRARSASSTRFGRPVSGSRVERNSMRASSCLRPVTSAAVPR
jgi:hypothetical protein